MTQVKFALKWNIYGHHEDTPYKEIEKLGVAADDLGFDGVFCIDHLFLPPNNLDASTFADPNKPYFLEAWTALAAIAAVTKRVQVGPQVTPICLRHPVFIARMATTIDRISNGRMVLQVGTGWHKDEFEKFGFAWDEKFSVRYDKMIEGVEVIKRLWLTDGPANYEGKYYTLKDAPLWPKPVQKPHPPIWFGGMGKKVRSAVARYGDGWHPAMPHVGGIGPQMYAQALAEILEEAQSVGRKKEEITPGAFFYSSIDYDRSKAAERALRLLKKRKEWAGLTLEDVQREGTIIVGTPDECLKALEQYVEAGVRYITVTFPPHSDTAGILRGLELYSEKILPRFR